MLSIIPLEISKIQIYKSNLLFHVTPFILEKKKDPQWIYKIKWDIQYAATLLTSSNKSFMFQNAH